MKKGTGQRTSAETAIEEHQKDEGDRSRPSDQDRTSHPYARWFVRMVRCTAGSIAWTHVEEIAVAVSMAERMGG